MFNVRKVPSHLLDSISFNTYTKDEILQLSVLEVKNHQTFNQLGHPNPYGVYDLAFGPNDRDELCTTCGQNSVHCPGHLGHISLPLPVFNPVFLKTLVQLIKGSCLTCHSLKSSKIMSELVYSQLCVLDFGLVNAVQDLQELASEVQSEESDKTVVEAILTAKLKAFVTDVTKDLDKSKVGKNTQIKAVVECRQRIVRNFIRDHLTKANPECPHCEAVHPPVYCLQNNRIVVGTISKRHSAKSKKPSKKKGNEDGLEETVEEPKLQEEEAPPGKVVGSLQTLLTPKDAQKHLHELWENEQRILKYLFRGLVNSSSPNPMDIFFLEIIPVPPSRFRPIAKVKDQRFENPQSAALSKVVQSSIIIRHLLSQIKDKNAELPDEIKETIQKMNGKTTTDKLQFAWIGLQSQVNGVVDSEMDYMKNDQRVGVKQIIEKKEGLFRKHMMGKRVNYAARSVISPDPYIAVDEIGIPEIFAKKLTYPQPVTPWNVRQLRQAVINGPNVHPGATLVEGECGSIIKLSNNKAQREAIAKQLLTPTAGEEMQTCKVVYRHLRNGDILLLNRQPTLHKPSIMAHKAKILPKEKTLRLHYSNCKTYNADFDGDEMNAHFPQNELARAEGFMIANVNNQYLVPKDGTPLGGLIQDHIIAGVKMTLRGSFFSREDYQQLCFLALSQKTEPIYLLPPSIMKPVQLWSGKQIISTVLINLIPKGKSLINMEGSAKISVKNWQKERPRKWNAGGSLLNNNNMTESEFIIRNGELLTGVLDKANCGPTPYGLIHCCYELYGGSVSGSILSSLGRLFTCFLQMQGFTLGVEDILILAKADKKRRKIMKMAAELGISAAADAFGIEDSTDFDMILEKYKTAHRSKDELPLKQLDMCMKSKIDDINNEINWALMPKGLLKHFPENSLQLMVQSGAKGTTVNTMQISCLLGQIELEGRRPPLMLSGRTLPCFRPYDLTPKAGGFVSGRFLTGICPQEYFFHCMAGREGLVDTAVKTSRSGYLQRCLIKHLEGVFINYDLTVRDSDGSVIQFLYGEDSLDIQKVSFLKSKQLQFLAENHAALLPDEKTSEMLKSYKSKEARKKAKLIRKWIKKHGGTTFEKRQSPFLLYSNAFLDEINTSKHPKNIKDVLLENWFNLKDEDLKIYRKQTKKCPDPVLSQLRPDTNLGAISEKLELILENYISENPYEILTEEDDNLPVTNQTRIPDSEFRDMIYFKVMQSICEPGEAVGLLAAQSVGEPSTQMTLNTFHFAGRGEMNVTLGIPRMREILMTATEHVATPSMEIPFRRESVARAEEFRIKFNKVELSQVLEKIEVTEKLNVSAKERSRLYRIQLNFLPQQSYSSRFCVTPSQILNFVERIFIKQLISAVHKKFALLAESKLLTSATKLEKKGASRKGDKEEVETKAEPNEDRESSDEEAAGEDDDAADSRLKTRHKQEREYEEPEEEEIQANLSENEDFESVSPTTVQDTEEDVMKSDEIEPMEIKSPSKSKCTKKDAIKRKKFVKDLNAYIHDYNFDMEYERSCDVTLKFNLQNSKLDMLSVVQEAAKKAVVYQINNINRAFISGSDDAKILKTEGVNIVEMFQYKDVLDVNKLYSNDIHAIAATYGIEAASRVIVKEIQSVFRVYGIEVDPRHLLLIADYMTFDGTYKPFNRMGMESNSSPLQQMSFETTMHFLKTATLLGLEDRLKSPSARLVVGNVVGVGTGCFDLVHPLVSSLKFQ